MATFYNQASLSLGGSVINSNITEGEIVSGAGLTKTAASANYGPGDGITYVVSIVNNGVTEYSGLTLTDDLGRFTAPGGIEVVPLTFVQGSVLYYIDGVLQPAPEAEEVDGQLLVRGINVPAGGNVTVIYEARANGFAPLGAAASITNTVTAGGTSCELYYVVNHVSLCENGDICVKGFKNVFDNSFKSAKRLPNLYFEHNLHSEVLAKK